MGVRSAVLAAVMTIGLKGVTMDGRWVACSIELWDVRWVALRALSMAGLKGVLMAARNVSARSDSRDAMAAVSRAL